jgi:hypothetical protein
MGILGQRYQNQLLIGWNQLSIGTDQMTPEIFAITYVFHSQRRRGSRMTPRHITIRLPSGAPGHFTPIAQRSQHGAWLSEQGSQSRAGKISELRHAVESGTYCVSAEQIAEKIAQEMLMEMFT